MKHIWKETIEIFCVELNRHATVVKDHERAQLAVYSVYLVLTRLSVVVSYDSSA